MRGRMITAVAAIWLMALVLIPAKPVFAAQITIDGDSTEWSGAEMQSSTNEKIEKWAVLKDASYLYFYVQQNGGSQWGLPITDTSFDIAYASGQGGESTQIRFSYMMQEIKNAYYGTISGASAAYQPSSEANKYEIEFAVPLSFFAEDDFTITYCGASVQSSDIVSLSEYEKPEPTTAVYDGITIDGTFTDWDAVSKQTVGDESLQEIAAVFDGDYLYIYMEETDNGSATTAGEKSNGKFTIRTDLGRNTTFKLNQNSVEGIDGAKVSYSNGKYEIAIPASEIKQYRDTISIGYYMGSTMLVEDLANLQDDSREDKTFNGIEYDGSYTDWDYYPHQLVQYSTSGGAGEDAEAALYLDGTTLYGHVLSTLHRNEREFQPFTIRVNESEDTSINFRLITVDEDGTINMNPTVEDLEAGTYEYYLWDLNSGSTATNIHDDGAPVYGQMYLTVRKTAEGTSISDEMEYKIDLEKLAKHFDMDPSDLKMIQAQYINIGQEWVSIAGTSTGAAMGIPLCGLVVLGVWYYRKRRAKVA